MFLSLMRLTLGSLLGAAWSLAGAQTWQPQTSGTSSSLRGLSVVSASIAWASGRGGTVIRTTDGGAHWTVHSIPGAASFDLRAIAAFDAQTVVVAATAGRIWRTEDGGASWRLVYENADSTVFLDAIAFWPSDPTRGLVVGDPIDGRFFILVSEDAGRSWREASKESRPIAQPREGAFAASGSSLVMHGRTHAWIGTGVNAARVLRTIDGGKTWSAAVTPLFAGSNAAGVFSLSFADSLRGIAVGGDYEKAAVREATAATTSDGGVTWEPARTMPNGFRSAVAFLRGSLTAFAVGTNGIDRSTDGGSNWMPVDTTGYHTIGFLKDGTAWAGWATGGRGRVARFVIPDSVRSRP